MSDTVDLADARRRLAHADLLAAEHHLQMASEALHRALLRTDATLPSAFIRTARMRIASAKMHTRKAKEGKR